MLALYVVGQGSFPGQVILKTREFCMPFFHAFRSFEKSMEVK